MSVSSTDDPCDDFLHVSSGYPYVFGPGATAREVYASRTVAQDFAAKLRAMFGNAGLRGHPDLIELVASSSSPRTAAGRA